MAIHESTLSPDNRNHLTRRQTLYGAAPALAAVGALPAVVLAEHAIAAELPGDVDPWLAELEAGYRRWQALLAQADRLRRRASRLAKKADAAVRPLLPPEPPIPPELAAYSHHNSGLGKKVVWWGTVPREGKVGEISRAHNSAKINWRHARNALLADQPDQQRSDELDAAAADLEQQADALRWEVLNIPTRTPRGLLIKLALATDTPRLEDFDKRFRRPRYYGTFDGADDLLPPLLADLRAMVGEAA